MRSENYRSRSMTTLVQLAESKNNVCGSSGSQTSHEPFTCQGHCSGSGGVNDKVPAGVHMSVMDSGKYFVI